MVDETSSRTFFAPLCHLVGGGEKGSVEQDNVALARRACIADATMNSDARVQLSLAGCLPPSARRRAGCHPPSNVS